MWGFASSNPFWFFLMVVVVVAIISDTISNLKGK